MPTFNDYSSDGKLLGTRKEPLSSDNLERYIAEYGNERAQGYFEAFNDFMEEMKWILHHESPINKSLISNNPPMVRNKLKHLYNKNIDVLTILNQFTIPIKTESLPNNSVNIS